MRMTRIVAIVLIGMLVVTGACGKKAPGTKEIKIELIDATEEWRPSTVAIFAGDSVIFRNTSLVRQHAVISGEGLFDEILFPGQSLNYTFTKNGTFTYHDNPYTSVGTIYVK